MSSPAVIIAPGTLSYAAAALSKASSSSSAARSSSSSGLRSGAPRTASAAAAADALMRSSNSVATASSAVASSASVAASPKPQFPALTALASSGGKSELRTIRVPPHRYTPLKESWDAIVKPIVEQLKLQIRMNTRSRAVEIKSSAYTVDAGVLQKAEDYVRAFMLGFDLLDAVALLRLDDLYVETFEVTDVKPLKGDHLSRAIGRIAGIGGKTKHSIENATRTRIVVADSKVHILGAFSNIQVARDAVCSLILGAPPGKVHHNMQNVAARMQNRY